MIKVRRLDSLSALPDTLAARLESFFFTSRGFLDLWRHVGGRPVWWIAEATGKTVAVMPGVEFGRKPLARFQSMPDGCYGRVVLDGSSPGKETELAGSILEAVCDHGYAKCFVTDFDGSFPNSDSLDAVPSTTLLVDISEPDWLPPDKKLQSEIRKAQREGVAIERFDRRRHMEAFLTLMQQTEARHNRAPKYDEAFFAALADLAERDDRVVWHIVEHEGRPAASHINLVLDKSVLNWQVYFDKEFSFLKANQIMLVKLADEMRERGIGTLNMGQSPIDAEALQSYKQKWGGVEHEYRTLTARKGIGRLL